jgi:hypothetical protein
MMARFLWNRRKELREIATRARETADPVERLRYVRGRMNSLAPPKQARWRPVRRITAMIAAAIGAALLIWRIR